MRKITDMVVFIRTGNWPEPPPKRPKQTPPFPLPASAVPEWYTAEPPGMPSVQPAKAEPEGYTLNRDKSVAVATDYYTSPEMAQCPRGAKCILIGKGGVATISIYDGDPFWVEWAPLPKRREA